MPEGQRRTAGKPGELSEPCLPIAIRRAEKGLARVGGGISVFIMAATAYTVAVSRFSIGGMPDMTILLTCANKASEKTLNRAIGVVLAALGTMIMAVNAFGRQNMTARDGKTADGVL